MARARMVTRTIQSTKATILCIDTVKEQPFKQEINLSGVFKDEAHMMKAVKKVIDSDTIKAVNVVSAEVVEAIYGMSEQDFIANAQIMPDRVKANSTEAE